MPARPLRLALLLLSALGLVAWWWLRPAPPAPAAIVPIQDGHTIDFSSGQPEIRHTPADQAAMEAALQRMQEAAAEVTFPASAPPPPPPENP